MKQQQHLFTNKMLRALLVPIIMEQLLNALMGTVDTMMVSNVSWTEESRDGKQISQAGTFYHNSHFCLHRCAWTCFPCTAS